MNFRVISIRFNSQTWQGSNSLSDCFPNFLSTFLESQMYRPDTQKRLFTFYAVPKLIDPLFAFFVIHKDQQTKLHWLVAILFLFLFDDLEGFVERFKMGIDAS